MIFHAVPYSAQPSDCRCPVQVCGGIIPDPDCADHGNRENPAMEWHPADGERCRQLAHPHQ